MAITAVTRTTESGILKEMYPDSVIHELINQKVPFISRLKRRGWSVDEGNKFHVPIETQLDEGGGERSEMDDSPEPSTGGDQMASFNFKTYQHTVRVSGEAARTRGAITPILRRRAVKAMNTTRLDAEIGALLPASGLRADVTAAASAGATTIEVSTGQYLRPGMHIDVLDAAGALSNGVSDARITAIADAGNDNGSVNLTLSKGLLGAIDTTYEVFKFNTRNKGVFGLQDIVSALNPSAGNYGNIDRTAVTDWQARTVPANGDSLSAELLEAAYNEILVNGDGSTPTVVWAHPYPVSDLIAQAKNDRRFDGQIKTFEIWGTGVTFRGMDIIPWRFCPYDTAFMLSEGMFRVAHPKGAPEFEWVEDIHDGKGGRWMKTAGKWAYEGLLVGQRQIVCNAPNANCLISGLAWSATGTIN